MNKEIDHLLKNILNYKKLNKEFENDWILLEEKLKCKFSTEFKCFIETMSNYSCYGDILNISENNNNGNDTIEITYEFELKYGSWNKYWIPFLNIGNGDYFCLISNECPDNKVYYYCHEANNIRKENDSFEDWLNSTFKDFL